MARVWRAHDDVLDREVAVKVLTEEDADPEEFARAHNEARCAARLAHPNVADVYDFGTSRRAGRGAAYVVMELAEGPLLSGFLQGGPPSWRFAVRVCAEIAAGLAAAHSEGIVHRDIKPTNVVLTDTGAKILDFGIAARVGEPDQAPDGTVVGSAADMAPERMAGASVAPALDVYSLGVVLYRCLTAGLPWDAQTGDELLRAHRELDPRPLPPIEGLAPEVVQMYTACLDKDPDRRPTAMAAALILAASVGAQVYLPTLLKRPPRAPEAPPAPDLLDAETITAHQRNSATPAGP
jgi:serine/threonine-protein kinase